MAIERQAWTPDVAIAPGETIREILQERGVTQTDFATRLGKSEKFVSQLINGKAPISHETAIELERVLGVPSAFWNAMESTYRDLLARAQQADSSAEIDAWAKSFPVKEMAKHGWLAREASATEQAHALLGYFGVASVEAYADYWGDEKRLAARMSQAFPPETQAIAAWLRAGEIAAERIRTAPYDEVAFRGALARVRSATRLSPDQWQPLLVDDCAAAGVAVVLVPDLPKTRCHAVSWWASRSRAVIQLGLRYRTDDQLWFSFFHEAGHLLLDRRGRSGINDLSTDPMSEDRANQFAADFLIPPAEYAAFVARPGRTSRAAVVEFAQELGVAPGIVVGRLQRDGVIPRSWLNDLKVSLDWGR